MLVLIKSNVMTFSDSVPNGLGAIMQPICIHLCCYRKAGLLLKSMKSYLQRLDILEEMPFNFRMIQLQLEV